MKRAALISSILGAALAIAPAAFAAALSDNSAGAGSIAAAPGGVQPATRGTLLRSQALARHDGDPLTQSVPLTGKALSAFYDTGAVTSSQPPVQLTGKALSSYYDTGAVAQPTDPLGTSTISSKAGSPSGDSVDVNWSAVAGAILLGVLLIGMAAAAVSRRRHQPSF